MTEIRDALLRMVKAYRLVGEMLDAFLMVGLNENPLMEAHGEIAEAVYQLLGEHVDEFIDSVTHLVLNVPHLSDERRAKMLYAEWKKNHPEMPAPNTCEHSEFLEMFNKTGGYYKIETPEGDWT